MSCPNCPHCNPELGAPGKDKPTYYGPKWPTIRRAVLARDGYKCQGPEHDDRMNGGDHSLLVHHIEPLRLFGGDYEAANVDGNLITLCTICHRREHMAMDRAGQEARS